VTAYPFFVSLALQCYYNIAILQECCNNFAVALRNGIFQYWDNIIRKYCCIVAWEYCCNVARKHTMEDMSRFRQYWSNLAARLAILL